MDQAIELKKLSQLMANGTISKKEFNKKKQEILFPNKKRRGLWWKLPLLFVVVIFVLALLNGGNKSNTSSTASSSALTTNTSAPVQTASDASGQPDTPECASDFAKENVESTYANQPDTSVRLKFLDWKNIKQVSYDPRTKERRCQGYFVFNTSSQEGNYSYKFYYVTPTSANWLIAIDPINEEGTGTTGK